MNGLKKKPESMGPGRGKARDTAGGHIIGNIGGGRGEGSKAQASFMSEMK